MTSIRILPDIVVSRIAAGEVIERPYSVVKELIENSIDASATSITVELTSGGKRYISVSDNGTGMTRDDAIMSLERHATSKIKDVNDIFTLKTLGFRGEALPSIASVSGFTLRTKTADQLSGTEIRVHGGVIKKVDDAGCPKGTTVEVERLFFNTPPRLKFMKTVETELGRILEVVQREAICNYGVSFEVIHNGKQVLNLNRKSGYRERISDIMPDVELFDIIDNFGENSVLAYMSSPFSVRTTTQKLFTFVNGRPVRDRFITRIIMDSYGKQIENKKFPQGVMFLNIPSSELDVNVHPTKHEIRFRNQKVVADLVKRSLGSMLRDAPWLRYKYGYDGNKRDAFFDSVEHFRERNKFYDRGRQFGQYNESLLNRDRRNETGRSEEGETENHMIDTNRSYLDRNDSAGEADIFDGGGYFSGLKVVGQVKSLYILCENVKGIVVVDQHAAHERVNYEKVKNIYYRDSSKNIQDLLIPEVIELSQGEVKIYENHLNGLERLGFISERFGSSAVRIKSAPSLLGNTGLSAIFRDLLGELDEVGEGESLNEKIDLIFATIACHSSVTANQALNDEQIRAMFKELDEAESPFHCPHGRPVVRELGFDYIERLFRRT